MASRHVPPHYHWTRAKLALAVVLSVLSLTLFAGDLIANSSLMKNTSQHPYLLR